MRVRIKVILVTVILLLFAGTFRVLIVHPLILFDYKNQRATAEEEMHLLKKLYNDAGYEEGFSSFDELLTRYQEERFDPLPDRTFLEKNYQFITKGFSYEDIPIIIGRNDNKMGGYVLFKSGIMVWKSKKSIKKMMLRVNNAGKNSGNQ